MNIVRLIAGLIFLSPLFNVAAAGVINIKAGDYTAYGVTAGGDAYYEGVARVTKKNKYVFIDWYIYNKKYSCSFKTENRFLEPVECEEFPDLFYFLTTDDKLIGGWNRFFDTETLTYGAPEVEITFRSPGAEFYLGGNLVGESLTLTYDWSPGSIDDDGCLNITAPEVSYNIGDKENVSIGDMRFCDGVGNYEYDPVNVKTDEKGIKAESIEVRLVESNGTFKIPVTINGKLTLDFIMDTGASDVLISPDVFSTLVRTGTLKGQGRLSKKSYVLADGRKQELTSFIIRSMEFGGKTIENVEATVSNSMTGHMLLGQSALRKLGSYSIDYEKKLMLLQRDER